MNLLSGSSFPTLPPLLCVKKYTVYTYTVCCKVPLQVTFFKWRHFVLVSIKLISPRSELWANFKIMKYKWHHIDTTWLKFLLFTSAEAQFIFPDWGDKVDYGIGLSYWPVRLHRLAVRYENPVLETDFISQQGTMNLSTVFLLYKKGAMSLALFENTPSRILEKFVWKRLKIGNFFPSAVKVAKPHIPYFSMKIIFWISFLQLFHKAWKQRYLITSVTVYEIFLYCHYHFSKVWSKGTQKTK